MKLRPRTDSYRLSDTCSSYQSVLPWVESASRERTPQNNKHSTDGSAWPLNLYFLAIKHLYAVPLTPPPIQLLYLKPLAVWLHLQHHTRVGFGKGVTIRDAPAGHSQLHFGQARRADEAQRGLCRLIDVTHAERAITHWNEREREEKMGLICTL